MVHLNAQLEAVELFMREVRAIDDPAALLDAEMSIRALLESSDVDELAVRQAALQLILEAKLQLQRPKARAFLAMSAS